MEPKPDPIKEILSELFGLLETSETQSMAILEFLKDQKIVTEEKLKPYLDRAGNASSVRWRAARARMEYLLTPQGKKISDPDEGKEGAEKKEEERPEQDKPEPKPAGSVQKSESSEEKNTGETKDTNGKKTDNSPEQSRGAADASPNTGNKPSHTEESKKQPQTKSDNPADASASGNSGAKNEGISKPTDEKKQAGGEEKTK